MSAFRLSKSAVPKAVAMAAMLVGTGSSASRYNSCLSLSSCGAAAALPVATSDDPASLKKRVGFKSVDDYVRSGMVVGLGTGSTAYFAVERLGEKLKSGELTDIVAVPTSEATKKQAEQLGITLSTLDIHGKLDIAIDGTDFPVFNELRITPYIINSFSCRC